MSNPMKIKKKNLNSNQQEDAQNNQNGLLSKKYRKSSSFRFGVANITFRSNRGSQNVSQIEEDSSDQAEKTDSSRINSVSAGVTTSVA